MTEINKGNHSEYLDDLGLAVTEWVYSRGEKIKFVTEKYGRELVGEFGLLGSGEHNDSILTQMFGELLREGMKLELKGTTSMQDVRATKVRLLEGIEGPAARLLDHVTYDLLEKGMTFHREEMLLDSPRVLAWCDEYDALFPEES